MLGNAPMQECTNAPMNVHSCILAFLHYLRMLLRIFAVRNQRRLPGPGEGSPSTSTRQTAPFLKGIGCRVSAT